MYSKLLGIINLLYIFVCNYLSANILYIDCALLNRIMRLIPTIFAYLANRLE